VSDRPDPESTDDSPEIAEVRRLLADARPAEPMPAEVVARMDRVLARLGDETPVAPVVRPGPAGGVVSIAAHRRRKAAGLLVAAAAIVVGGVAVAPYVHPSSSRSTATAGGAEDRAQVDNEGGQKPQPIGPESSPAPAKVPAPHGRVVVRPRHFSTDALNGRALLGALRPTGSATFDYVGCAVHAQPSRVVPAEYRHAPAALVYRRPEGSSQVVDLYVCGSARPIRSATLPAP
jgi:hypothetical protein